MECTIRRRMEMAGATTKAPGATSHREEEEEEEPSLGRKENGIRAFVAGEDSTEAAGTVHQTECFEAEVVRSVAVTSEEIAEVLVECGRRRLSFYPSDQMRRI